MANLIAGSTIGGVTIASIDDVPSSSSYSGVVSEPDLVWYARAEGTMEYYHAGVVQASLGKGAQSPDVSVVGPYVNYYTPLEAKLGFPSVLSPTIFYENYSGITEVGDWLAPVHSTSLYEGFDRAVAFKPDVRGWYHLTGHVMTFSSSVDINRNLIGYKVAGSSWYGSHTSNLLGLKIKKNGETVHSCSQRTTMNQYISTLVYLDGHDDYVELFGVFSDWNNFASRANIGLYVDVNATSFHATFVGAG